MEEAQRAAEKKMRLILYVLFFHYSQEKIRLEREHQERERLERERKEREEADRKRAEEAQSI